MKELELYIHIPFCISKCKYCDFLSAPSKAEERQEYIESLCSKIRSYGAFAKAYHIVSIFMGGGTPSVLERSQTKAIFDAVYDTFYVDKDAEITIEVNPGTADEEKLILYKSLGINRLSIGLQSADDQELKMLGRIHTYEEFADTYQLARKAGFTNINVDLISAIPFQTSESFERTLRMTAELSPEHISAYSLIIEEGTPFYERYGGGEHAEELPDEEEERLMYEQTKTILEQYGYRRYEISNYAKEGYECRHNLGYWDRREYLGIGTGAASLVDNHRWVEGQDPKELSMNEQMEEFMFLGLRKIQGVSKKRFYQMFHVELKEIYGEVIKRLCEKQLLKEDKEYVFLSDRGNDISNYVMSEFLL